MEGPSAVPATQNGTAYELLASVFASVVQAGLIASTPCTL